MMFYREVRRRKGFSLIELLITVTIMLLLVGAAAFYLEDYVYKSKVSKAQQDLDMFRSALFLRDSLESNPFSNYNYADSALNTYYYDWNSASVAAFDASWGTFGGATAAWSNFATNSLNNLIGTYLKNVPKDPWGMPYIVNTAAGYVASMGTDMKTGIGGNTAGITEAGREKDIVSYYLGDRFVLTDVIVYDRNNDGSIQAGEYVDFKFNKDVQIITGTNLVASIKLGDEETSATTNLLSAAPASVTAFNTVGKLKDNGRVIRCVFNEDHPAANIIGKWASVVTDQVTGLGYSINANLFDMDQYIKSPASGIAFGRPVMSTCNPARQVRFD